MSAPTPSFDSFGTPGSGDFTPTSTPGGAPPAKKSRTLLPEKMRPAAITVGGLALLMVIVQIVNSLGPSLHLNANFGLIPRRVSGLDGILLSPLLHGSWGHLLGNLVPFLIFGLLLFVGGVRQFWVVTVLVWLTAGIGLWLAGPSNSVTIGASGLVFGWLAYLVARGIFTRNIGQILIGAVLLLLWGSMFWTGIVSTAVKDFVGDNYVSWQGHLFGAIGGVLAAFLVAKADGPRRKQAAA